jgi:cytochrome b pre-mRNA-processing protein 3
MLTRLKLRRDRHQKARSLYGSIVTQARTSDFYAHWGVPDTAEARFEMIALHLVAVLLRLGHDGQVGQKLARSLTEIFAVDVDDNLREMAVGDLAVPRHVKRAVGALQGRHARYRAALAVPGDEALAAGVREAFGVASKDLDVPRICAYIRRVSHRLGELPSAEVLAGRIAWPQIDAAERDVGGARQLTEGENAR